MASDYKYNRPVQGQIEDIWFDKLSVKEQLEIEEETRASMIIRMTIWNTRYPNRQIPRPN